MAVSGLPNSNSILISARYSRERVPVQQAGSPQNVMPAAATSAKAGGTPVPLAVQAVAPADALLQNELLVNEILRNVAFANAEAASPLLIDTRSPLLTLLQATGELDLIQQNALQVNDTLLNLGFNAAEADSPLLIDGIPAALEAAGITEDLTLIQQNALFVNETLQDLGSASLFYNPPQPRPGAVPPAVAAAEGTAATATGVGALGSPAVDLTMAAAESPGATPAAGAGEEVALPVTAVFLSQELTPATLPVVLFPDRIPYVLVVYLINDPAPLPSSAREPIDVDLPPAAAIAEIRPVGNARFRQAQLRARARERTGNGEYNEALVTGAQVERSIRYSLDLVNADMAAHDRPFHLVFAKDDKGFALDVYDCSYSDACWLTYKVPIPADNMTGVLDNLERETGIIVDTDL